MTEIPPTWRNAIDDIVPRPKHARRPEPETLPHHPDDSEGREEGGAQTHEKSIQQPETTNEGGGHQKTTSAGRMESEEKGEKKTMEKPMCPKGCGRPSPGLRGDGQPKICKECKSEDSRRRLQREKGEPGQPPARNIPKNIPKNIPEGKGLPEFPAPGEAKDKSPYLRTMDELQSLCKYHINKAREIHETMVSLKRVSGVEYEIKALSLVG